MIDVKDKKDSIRTIRELGLNFFPQDVFMASDVEGVANFVKKYPSEEYVLRDASKAKGKFVYVKNLDEILAALKNYSKDVTIAQSYRPFKEDLVLVGDIKVTRGVYGDVVDITARDDEEATQRNIYENPKYNMHASLEENRLWNITGFSKLMSYISEHELYGVILEFLVYDRKVGVNKENVVITEIRSNY